MKQILITCDTEVGELHANRADAFEIFIKGEIGGGTEAHKRFSKRVRRRSGAFCGRISV